MRGEGGVRVKSGAGPYARSVLKGVQTDKTAITAKQETGLGADRVENRILAMTARGNGQIVLLVAVGRKSRI